MLIASHTEWPLEQTFGSEVVVLVTVWIGIEISPQAYAPIRKQLMQ